MPSFKLLDNLGASWENSRESLRDDLLQFATALNQLLNTPTAHPLLDGSANSDTVAGAPTAGALVVGVTSVNTTLPKWASLPIGANHRVLKSDGVNPSWGQATLTTDVSGVLPTANGGTSVDIASAALPLGSGQIQFPATQNPSAGANVLDDYEEGTLTPVLAFGGSSVGITYGGHTGTYTKIGNLVTCFWRITLSSKGAQTGAATISGLPFSVGNPTGAVVTFSYFNSLAALTGALAAYANATTIQLNQQGAAGVAALTDANFTNTSDVIGGCVYQV